MVHGYDAVCVGGGVIGLTAAYELAGAGLRVRVVDQGPIGGEASWAGAGIISPAAKTPRTAAETLHAFSVKRLSELSGELWESTGVDVELLDCGGLDLMYDEEQRESLSERRRRWADMGVQHERLEPKELAERNPGIREPRFGAYWLPGYRQVRNPRLVRALALACTQRGVALSPRNTVVGMTGSGDAVDGVELADGTRIAAGHVVISAGAWSARLMREQGYDVPVFPVRGQIISLQATPTTLSCVAFSGRRYLVPRRGGLILVGSTEENAGFEKEVTEEGATGLRRFAASLSPALADAPVSAMWSGLRPGTSLSTPIIGRLPGKRNLWLSTGHFRQGVQLAAGSGKLLADALVGKPSFVDVEAFALDAERADVCPAFHS